MTETSDRNSYNEAIAALRRDYLATRQDGETAAQWLIRTRPHSSLRACAQFAERPE